MLVAPDGALQPAHLAQAVFHAVVARVVHGLLGAPDGHRGFGRDLFGALQRGSQHGLLRVEHLVDQAIVQGLGGAQAAAGVGQLLDHAQRDELGQALQRAHVGHHADVDLLDAEERILRGVADAARRDHVHRAADAAAMDGHDDRNAQVFQPREGGLHVGQQVKNGGAALGALVVYGDGAAKGFERHARAEMLACAADDERPCRTFLMQVSQHRVQLTPEGRVHGIQRFWLVQNQMGHLRGGAEGETGEGVDVGVHGLTL